MKRIAVFCGSQVGREKVYTQAAQELGRLLVQRNLGLVFGAGHIGLMGVLADAVLAAGGEAIGVIPRSLVQRELAHKGLTQLHIVETMHQRKALMEQLADGFLALPGGYGTCDEFFEMLTWAQLKLHRKPIGLLNIAGFFDGLLSWVEHAVTAGFIKPSHRQLLLSSDEPVRLLDMLDRAK